MIAEESLSLTRGGRNPLVATGGSTGRLFLADSAEYCRKRRASQKKKKKIKARPEKLRRCYNIPKFSKNLDIL